MAFLPCGMLFCRKTPNLLSHSGQGPFTIFSLVSQLPERMPREGILKVVTGSGQVTLLDCHPLHQRVASSISSQGACLGFWACPWLGRVQETMGSMFLTSMTVSLSVPSSLRISK